MADKTYQPLYRVTDDADCDSSYEVLVGPNGFECILTEPEDRCWSRDLRDVVNELNRQHALIQRLQTERDMGMMWLFLEFRAGVPIEEAPSVSAAITEALERVSGRALMVLPQAEMAAVRGALAQHDKRATNCPDEHLEDVKEARRSAGFHHGD
jgi:hypothetical protein